MSEISKILAKIAQGGDVELEPGLTSSQIDWYLNGLWFQLTEEAYDFYQQCDGLKTEDFYILSLGGATDSYREWSKDWGCEFDLLPVAASDDRCFAIQVNEEKYATSPIYEVMYNTDPHNAQVGHQSFKEMLIYHCFVDL